MPNYDGQYKTTYQDYDGRDNDLKDPKKKDCCIVTPDQKVFMISETTKSIIEKASPELSQAILGDLRLHASKIGNIEGREVFDATNYKVDKAKFN